MKAPEAEKGASGAPGFLRRLFGPRPLPASLVSALQERDEAGHALEEAAAGVHFQNGEARGSPGDQFRYNSAVVRHRVAQQRADELWAEHHRREDRRLERYKHRAVLLGAFLGGALAPKVLGRLAAILEMALKR